MIEDRLVCGIENDQLSFSSRSKFLLTLQKAIELCQINELSEQRMKKLCGSTSEEYEVKYPRRKAPTFRQQRQKAPGLRKEADKIQRPTKWRKDDESRRRKL